MCYGFSGSFLQADFKPGPLNIAASLENSNLREIIRSVIKEGCIEETLSAIEAKFASYLASDNMIKKFLVEIASDETKHAQFAWNTISWFLKKYPKEEKFVITIFRNELKRQQSPMNNVLNSVLEVSEAHKYDENILRKY